MGTLLCVSPGFWNYRMFVKGLQGLAEAQKCYDVPDSGDQIVSKQSFQWINAEIFELLHQWYCIRFKLSPGLLAGTPPTEKEDFLLTATLSGCDRSSLFWPDFFHHSAVLNPVAISLKGCKFIYCLVLCHCLPLPMGVTSLQHALKSDPYFF